MIKTIKQNFFFFLSYNLVGEKTSNKMISIVINVLKTVKVMWRNKKNGLKNLETMIKDDNIQKVQDIPT